jgi:hypothetical protein
VGASTAAADGASTVAFTASGVGDSSAPTTVTGDGTVIFGFSAAAYAAVTGTRGGIQRLKETKVKKRDESVRTALRDIIEPPAAEIAEEMREVLSGHEAIEAQVEAFVAKQEGVQDDEHEKEQAKRARRRSGVLRLLMLD